MYVWGFVYLDLNSGSLELLKCVWQKLYWAYNKLLQSGWRVLSCLEYRLTFIFATVDQSDIYNYNLKYSEMGLEKNNNFL